MKHTDLHQANMDIGYLEHELKHICKRLRKWESLSPDDLIYTANCIKAAGVNNYTEYCAWEDANPDKGIARSGNEVRIIQLK